MPGGGRGQRLRSSLGVPPTRVARATPEAGEALGRSHLREAGVQLALTTGPREGSETGPLGAVRLGSQQRTELSPGGTRQAVVAGNPAKGAEPLTPRGRDDHRAGGGRQARV